MAGTKGIIEIIVVIAAIYGAWMYRDQIMAFLKSHGLDLKSGAGGGNGDNGEGPKFNPVDEEKLSKMSDKDIEALGMGMALEKYQDMKKSSLARSGWMGRSYYGRISV